ncbi:Uncharacterised protein [Segatella copri]|nr:Uncharacterised protein [Segatella copri]
MYPCLIPKITICFICTEMHNLYSCKSGTYILVILTKDFKKFL